MEGNKTARGRAWLWLFLSLACVGVDQLSKWLSVTYLQGKESVVLIPKLLRLTYLENTGAAFGSFTENRWVFMVFSTIAIVGVALYLLQFSERDALLRASLALILGGGIGNMIDRVCLGYVVDFIDFYGIWQYIFNIADSCVCIGAGLLALYCILSLRREWIAEQKKKAVEADAPQSAETAEAENASNDGEEQ